MCWARCPQDQTLCAVGTGLGVTLGKNRRVWIGFEFGEINLVMGLLQCPQAGHRDREKPEGFGLDLSLGK